MAVMLIPLCSPPDRNPRPPRFHAPLGAVDCHTHVFASNYRLAPVRGYTPPESTLADLMYMHDVLGVDRVVFVQPSVYGTDNSAVLDAMAQIPQRSRAVVAVAMSVTDSQLVDLDERGVRGVRLNLEDKGGMPIALDEIPMLAERVRELGWHLEFLFAPKDLGDLAPLLRSLPVPISVGHFGYTRAAAGIDYPPFRALVDLVAEGNTWVKLSAPYRLGVGDLPPWNEVVPLAQILIEANPGRMLWATDWPHPNKFGAVPNDADLIEQLERWVPDPALQEKILVDNPVALYRF
jgi:predicted TIM-barrel fold metal-dependent hydrolase